MSDVFIPHSAVEAEALLDPEYRVEWERTALARAVALRLVIYRADHKLSQRDLAERLGIKQPQVNRLESGDVNPSIDTLARIADRLEIEIALDIRPTGAPSRLIRQRAETTNNIATYTARAATITVAAT